MKTSNNSQKATKSQKVKIGLIISIISISLGSIFINIELMSLSTIFFVIGFISVITTSTIFARPKTKEDFITEINNLYTKLDGNTINNETANIHLKLGEKYFSMYKKLEFSDMSYKLDFAPLFSAVEEFKWVIENSHITSLVKNAQNQLNKIIERLIYNIDLNLHKHTTKECALVLAKLGNISEPILIAKLKYGFESTNLWIHLILYLIGDKSEEHLIPIINAINGSNKKNVRETAILAAGSIASREDKIFKELEIASNDKDKNISKMAIEVLNNSSKA